MTQEPTVAELEEAITHVSHTARRYSYLDPKYARLHEEINELLTDREKQINEGLTRMNGSL